MARACPWCRVVFDESEFLVDGKTRRSPSAGKTGASATAVPPRGMLAEKAASVLMHILCAARYASFDLLCAVAKLAQRIATWDEECDKAIYRLMCYIHTTLWWRQVGYVGDP